MTCPNVYIKQNLGCLAMALILPLLGTLLRPCGYSDLKQWTIANNHSLNVAKQMIRNISDLQLNVKIKNESVNQVYESNTLGVTIDQHLFRKVALRLFPKK